MGWRSTRIIIVFVLALGACGGGSDSGESDTTAPAPPTTSAADTAPETTVTEPPEATTTEAPETTSEPPDPDAPVVMLNRDDFGASFALNGAIVQHDGTFHMFFVASEASFGDARIARATSPDAISWTMVDDGLFGPDDVPFGGLSELEGECSSFHPCNVIVPSNAAVTANGDWVIYFHTQDQVYGTRDSVIGMATAPGPEGPWTVLAEPVLEPGADGAWDSDSVANPLVIATEDGFTMWYDGHAGDQDSTRDRAIGVATSTDGYTWSRVGAEPVLTAGEPGEWDELRVFDPNVVVSGDGYVMSYSTMRLTGNRSNNGYGLAYSDDGITWKKDGEAYLWLIQDGEFLLPGLTGSLSSTLIDGPNGHQMLFDLIFSNYGETYAVAPPT